MPRPDGYLVCLSGDVPIESVLPGATRRRCHLCGKPVWYSGPRSQYPSGYRLRLVCMACTSRQVQGRPEIKFAMITDSARDNLMDRGMTSDQIEGVMEAVIDELRYPRRNLF